MYLVLILCILWCLYKLYTNHRNAKTYKLPPVFPGALPLIGHMHQLIYYRKNVFDYIKLMTDFCIKSGGTTCGYFAGDTYYAVVDPEDAITVCNSFLQRHPMVRLGRWLGNGLITSAGAHYKHHRRLLNPAFSLPVLHKFLGVFNDQSRRLVEMLDVHAGQGLFDPRMLLKSLTLRTSYITVLGDIDDKNNDFLTTYVNCVETILDTIKERVIRPWLHNDFIYSFSEFKRKEDECIQKIDDITYEVIARKKLDMKNKAHLGALDESEDTLKPFVDILLEIAAESGLSDQEIRDELNTTVSASYETTAQQLTYILVYLGSYPEVQEKVYREIMEVVGDRDVQKQDLNKLVYTEAVIKEILRVIPTISMLLRYGDQDLKLKNYTIPAGAYVILLPGGIHQHSDWGPDVHKFNPDRWLNKETQTKFNNMNFAFSIGTRSCVGRKYAIISIKVAIVYLVRHFRMKADCSKLKLNMDVVTRAEAGYEVSLEQRNSKYDVNQNTPFSILNQNNTEMHGI